MDVAMTYVSRTFILIGLGCLLAACAGSESTYRLQYKGRYTYQNFRHFTQDRIFKIDVLAPPYSSEEFQNIIEAAVKRPSALYGVDVSTTPTEKATKDVKLVLHFNPERTWLGDTLCAERTPERDNAQTAGDLTILGAYCVRGEALSSIWGTVPDFQGTSDPRLPKLISFMTTRLFPVYDPDRGADCNKVSPVMCN